MQNTKEKDRRYKDWLPELAAVMLLAVQRVAAVSIYGLTLAGDLSLYELAEIAGAAGITRLPHTASYAYTCILSVFLRFLGNKWAIAVMLQSVLLFAVSLLFFFLTRRMYGRWAAFAFLLLLAVVPEFWTGYQRLAPDSLLLLLTGILLWLYISLLPDTEKRSLWASGFAAAAVGIAAGLLIWMDVIGLVFVAAMVVVLCLGHQKQTHLQKLFSVTGMLVGAVGAWLLLTWGERQMLYSTETAMTESSLLEMVQQYISLYTEHMQPMTLQCEDYISLLAALLMCILLLLSAFGSAWVNVELTGFIILTLCGSAGLHLMNMTCVSYNWIMLVFWLLACCGILQYVLVLCGRKRKESKNEQPMQKAENSQSAECDQKKRSEKEAESSQSIKCDQNEKEQKTVPTGTVHYIPNPLPLPKKHEKKEMKFDYEPLPEQMKFDYEPKADEEDYDLL